MDWSLVILILVVLYFGYRGYKKGLLKSASRIFSIVAGYVCAILYASQFTQTLAPYVPLQGIALFIAASLVLFIGASLAAGFIFWLIDKIRSDAGSVSTASSIGGATVGAATGILLAIVIVWAFALVRDISLPEDSVTAARSGSSVAEDLANKAVGKAVNAAMTLGSANPEVTRLVATLFESPAEITRLAQRLGHSEELSRLLNDPENQTILDRGDYQAVQKLPAFQQLVSNPDMQVLAASTGLTKEAIDNNQTLDAALAIKLTDVWGRAQRVKNDRRVQEIFEDPGFQQEIQSANPIALLTNDQVLELADIIFSEPNTLGDDSNRMPNNLPRDNVSQVPPESEKKVYSWTDEKGRIHFSDVKPDS